jgi:hypothetical protein
MLTIQKVRVKSSSHFSRCGQPQGNILMLAGGQLQVARRGHCSLYLPGYLSYSSQFIFSLVSIIDGYSQYPPGYLSYSSQFIFSLVSICLLVTLSTCLGTCHTHHNLYSHWLVCLLVTLSTCLGTCHTHHNLYSHWLVLLMATLSTCLGTSHTHHNLYSHWLVYACWLLSVPAWVPVLRIIVYIMSWSFLPMHWSVSISACLVTCHTYLCLTLILTA